MKKEKKVQVAAEKTKPTTAEIKKEAANLVEGYRKELKPKAFAELERRMAAALKKRKKPLTADNIRQIFVDIGLGGRKPEPFKPTEKKIRKKRTAKEKTAAKEASRNDGTITKMTSAADMKKVIARLKTESPKLANLMELLQEAGIIKGGVIWEAPEFKKDPELEELLNSLHSNYECFVAHAENGKKLWQQEVIRTVAETDPDVDKFFRGKYIDPISVRQLLDPHFMNEEFAGRLLKVKKALVDKGLMADWEEMPDIKTSEKEEFEKAAMKAARDRFLGMQAGMAACDLQDPFKLNNSGSAKISVAPKFVNRGTEATTAADELGSNGAVKHFIERANKSVGASHDAGCELISIINMLQSALAPVMKDPDNSIFPNEQGLEGLVLPEGTSALAGAIYKIEERVELSNRRIEACTAAIRQLIKQINL